MRIWPNGRPLHNHAPFSGQGVSAYAAGLYRNLRLIPQRPFLRQGDTYTVGSTNVTKTARIASTTGTAGDEVTLTPDLSAYNNGTVDIDVRHYKDDVECETVHPITVTLDVSGDSEDTINGAYTLLDTEVRTGGIVRVRFHWTEATNGLVVEQFVLSRTAGPTSPTDVTETASGSGIYEIDTAALSDASAYTFDVIAENTTESVSRTLGSVTFTADATGPGAPSSVTAEAY